MDYVKHKSEESVEDYLETILVLSRQTARVRAVDIAAQLGYSKPSVSVAMKNLKLKGYVSSGEDGYIHLTDEGRRIAERTYERHTLLTNWLIRLGVSPEVADADACKVEHDLSAESFEALKRLILNGGGCCKKNAEDFPLSCCTHLEDSCIEQDG